MKKYDWAGFEKRRLEEYFSILNECHARARSLEEMIADVMETPVMLKLMRIMGIGKINVFALITVIGDITRFSNSKEACDLPWIKY